MSKFKITKSVYKHIKLDTKNIDKSFIILKPIFG